LACPRKGQGAGSGFRAIEKGGHCSWSVTPTKASRHTPDAWQWPSNSSQVSANGHRSDDEM
jgi:hypothetical protein